MGLQEQIADHPEVPWPEKVELNDAAFRVVSHALAGNEPSDAAMAGRQKQFANDNGKQKQLSE
jgi:hypothetical protein